MDGARIIQLYGEAGRPLARARRLAGRRGRDRGTADIVALPAPAAPVAPQRPDTTPDALAELRAFVLRRLAGDYEIDEFGFDADLTTHGIVPLFKPLYDHWFRVDVNGIDNVPSHGGALLVANHAGGLWPLDTAMTALAVHTRHPAGRFLRTLSHELLFRVPGLGPLARKAGGTVACTDDADRLLAAGELVGVWPEGFKGIGKPFAERYRLQHFGRGGFVRSALRAGVPIIPVSIIGSEETHPVLGNARTLARVLDLPYFPLTPTFPWLGPLGTVPLPSKWYVEFGQPIDTSAVGVAGTAAADDPAAVFEVTDRVRETIQHNLYRLLSARQSVWR